MSPGRVPGADVRRRRPVLAGNSFVAAGPASLDPRAARGATWRDPGRLDAVLLDRFGAAAWHYQREQSRPDQTWRRAGMILQDATAPGRLAWDADGVLHALVPAPDAVAHLTLGSAGWRPAGALPGSTCALARGADGVLIALTGEARSNTHTRLWQWTGNTWVLRGRLADPHAHARPLALVPATARDEILPGSRLASGQMTLALPAGWFPLIAASVSESHLGDPLRRGRGWLQALAQEGDAVYHYHRQDAAGRVRWMRSGCLRLDPDAPRHPELPTGPTDPGAHDTYDPHNAEDAHSTQQIPDALPVEDAVSCTTAVQPSVKLAQITGERDTQPGRPSTATLSRSLSRSGIRGADLGVRFDWGSRSFLLFGDTHWGRHAPLASTIRARLADRRRRVMTGGAPPAAALASATHRAWRDARALAAALRDASRITLDSIAEIHPERGVTGLPGLPDVELHGAPLRIVGGLASRREYDVPLDAFAHDGAAYVFYSSSHGARHQVMGRSLLTRVVDPRLPITGSERRRTIDLQLLGTVSDRHLINISVDQRAGSLYLWGAGAYRADDLYLARLDIAAEDVQQVLRRRCPHPPRDRGAHPDTILSSRLRAPLPGLEFFAGLDAGRHPTWTTDEARAQPTAPGAIGELSIRWIEPLHAYAWLGMDAPEDPAGVGVMLRLAPEPWGPWGARVKLFDWRADGQSFDDPSRRFIKAHPEGDPVGDAIFGVQARSTGAAYAPYFFDARREGGDVVVRYTLSTWNPYQSVLMEHRLTPADLARLGAER